MSTEEIRNELRAPPPGVGASADPEDRPRDGAAGIVRGGDMTGHDALEGPVTDTPHERTASELPKYEAPRRVQKFAYWFELVLKVFGLVAGMWLFFRYQYPAQEHDRSDTRVQFNIEAIRHPPSPGQDTPTMLQAITSFTGLMKKRQHIGGLCWRMSTGHWRGGSATASDIPELNVPGVLEGPLVWKEFRQRTTISDSISPAAREEIGQRCPGPLQADHMPFIDEGNRSTFERWFAVPNDEIVVRLDATLCILSEDDQSSTWGSHPERCFWVVAGTFSR